MLLRALVVQAVPIVATKDQKRHSGWSRASAVSHGASIVKLSCMRLVEQNVSF